MWPMPSVVYDKWQNDGHVFSLNVNCKNKILFISTRCQESLLKCHGLLNNIILDLLN